MIWALGVIAIIVAGLPVTAWVTTRGLARRPSAPLKPYHGRADSWIHRQYGLDWADCSQIRNAVWMGRRVDNPALEDATHRLAAATLSGKVPGVRVLYLAAWMNIAIGLMMGALAISGLFWGSPRFFSLIYIPEGTLFCTLGWLNYVRGPRRQRANATRARELNQLGAHSST